MTDKGFINELMHARSRRRRQFLRTAILLLVVIVGGFFVFLMVGTRNYSFMQVIGVIIGENIPGASYAVGEIRLPRASLAVAVGFSFGTAGYSFQSLLRNQLASPDIIGISSGASAVGVIAIVLLGWGQTAVSLAALVGALVTALAIYLLSATAAGGFAGTRLILIGIGISAMLMSVVSFVLSQAAVWDLATASRWLSGSLNGATWERTVPVVISCSVVVPFLVVQSHRLYLLLLGDDSAAALGISVAATRLKVVIAAVFLVAIATASSGPVSFVAFMSGPIAMRISRPGPATLLVSGLVGAILVLISDFIGQYLLGVRYPVGVITGILGAPFLVYLLIAQSGAKGSTL
ncbi:MAG: iron chelate uptake ABC transporter family permease subunit [Corynebacterium sp.]|uniref:FecCD family ABC transporter permease n=1 Tax=Corynebacterium sp. TaxID=1720 RepID=UPI0026DDC6B1|nr:iron chelate uptake ABC transporter family permease subunit [Corynebacterium sp.]MDO5099529.1 iron chelate uptake ABC transporter family permease subunit [Corynebacterium sp.]